MARLAKGLVAAGVGRLVVAGGETSGAVVGALGVTALAHRAGDRSRRALDRIGRLASRCCWRCKSGNFGAPDFFTKAFQRLRRHRRPRLREAICALGAKLAARGLCPGTSGNISARIADGWLMTPTNSSLGELDPAQLSKLDVSGKHVGGDPPTKEALLHARSTTCGRRTAPSCTCTATHSVAISCLDAASCHHTKETTCRRSRAYFVMRVGTAAAGALLSSPAIPELADAIRDSPRGPSRRAAGQSRAWWWPARRCRLPSASIEELEETAKLHLLLQGFKVRSLS